jgi:hypothetical protein
MDTGALTTLIVTGSFIAVIIFFGIRALVVTHKEIKKVDKEIKEAEDKLRELEKEAESILQDNIWSTLIADADKIVFQEVDLKERLLRFDYEGRYVVFLSPADTAHKLTYTFMANLKEDEENGIDEIILSAYNLTRSHELAEILLERDEVREAMKELREEEQGIL